MGEVSDRLTLKEDTAKWYPSAVSTLESYLGVLIVKGSPFPDVKIIPLFKNLAYNLQYIEFLYRLLKDINISSVLLAQNIKSFVVHSAAVVEAVLYYVVVSTGNATTNKWQSCKKISNSYHINDDSFLLKTEIFKELALPIISEMTFDQITKKVEDKKLLGDNLDLYKAISRMRKLRNKIHLHVIDSLSDTDYKNFNNSEYELARKVLYGILTCPLFSNSTYNKCFDYLKND
jgi:hypothetical protein